jgi:hypothetical protein
MLRIVLLCVAMSFFGTISGQQIIHQEYIGWRGGSVEMNTFADKSGKLHCIVLANGDSMRIFLLNQADSLEKVFNIERKHEEEVRGGFIKDQKIFLFCGYKFPRGLHNYVINIGDGSLTQNLVVSKGGKGDVIERINAGDSYMVFSIDKKTSEFFISKWSSPDSADIISYTIEDKDIWKEITVSANFTREVKIVKVDEAGLPDADMVSRHRKLYLVHDTIFLLLNNNEGNTKVFAFDSKTKTASSRIIVNETLRTNVAPGKISGENDSIDYVSSLRWYVDNSFLLDGKLYFTSATVDRLHVIISDFYSGQLLKKFSVERDESIAFRNTPVIQDGLSFSTNATKELTKTSQLLRKMVAGNAVIAALKDSTGIGIIIGSNKDMAAVSSGGGSFVPGGATPGAMTFVPSGGFSRSGWTKSIRFSMLVDSNSLDHIRGDMEATINDRIQAFTNYIDIPNNAENLVFHDGRYLYTYYDKYQRNLVFCHFSY